MDTTGVIRQTIEVPAEESWAAIRGIDGLDRWFPIIHGCTVKGSGVGALRILAIGDGAELHDQIEKIDDATRTFVYLRTVHPFPCNRYVGTVVVSELGPSRSEVTWTIETDVSPANREGLSAFVTSAIGDGLVGMAAELESARG